MSERIFVDTSAWYALTDSSEGTRHQQTRATMQRLVDEGAELYTTTYVVAETHALVLNRMNRDVAEQVLDRFYASATRIIRATEGDETRARDLIHHHRDKSYTLTDAISFVVMQRLHLKTSWSLDTHFTEMGFQRIE